MCIRNSLSWNCQMFLIKTVYQFVRDSFVAPPISIIKNSSIVQKNSAYPERFHLNSFLLLISTSLQNLYLRITRNHLTKRHTLKKKSYVHWRGIATYLYSQLLKLLLISRNMNYPSKNLIYLKQVYTFKSNEIKFKNSKSSLPLKRFIVRFNHSFQQP